MESCSSNSLEPSESTEILSFQLKLILIPLSLFIFHQCLRILENWIWFSVLSELNLLDLIYNSDCPVIYIVFGVHLYISSCSFMEEDCIIWNAEQKFAFLKWSRNWRRYSFENKTFKILDYVLKLYWKFKIPWVITFSCTDWAMWSIFSQSLHNWTLSQPIGSHLMLQHNVILFLTICVCDKWNMWFLF